jgi:ribosome-associated protein
LLNLGKPRTSKGLALFCCKIAEEKLARDILILDLTNIEHKPADFFVICTCEVENQMKAVANEIERKCNELKIPSPRSEGVNDSTWGLLDFFDVVIHVMLPGSREYYKLEKLWGDAKFYQLSDSSKPHALNREELKVFIN